MPYLADASKNSSLLTTVQFLNPEFAFGTIVTQNTIRKRQPAPWIMNTGMDEGMGNIWYWIDENDCNPDRQKSRYSMYEQEFSCFIRGF